MIECDCGDHALSCIFDSNLGRGRCVDCQDNTAGDRCEICIHGFFRNESAPVADANVCIGEYRFYTKDGVGRGQTTSLKIH